MGAEKSPTWPADYARRRLWARSSDRGSIPRASTHPPRRKQAAWLYESKAERLSVIAPLIPCFPAILSCRICQLDDLWKKRFRLSSGLPIARCVEAITLRRNQGGYMPLELVRQDITKDEGGRHSQCGKHAARHGWAACGAIWRCGPGVWLLLVIVFLLPFIPVRRLSLLYLNLPSRYVIHTAGPIWRDGKHDEERLLRSCYRNSMELAARQGVPASPSP